MRGEVPDERTDGDRRVDRRTVLSTVGATGLAALGGCALRGGPSCPETGVAVETPDGQTRCVTPVEGDRPVAEYYGYDRGVEDSATTPDELAFENATVTALYRDGSGRRSLVVVNDDPTSMSSTGGVVPMTFEGVEGYRWQVRDDPRGTGDDADRYATADGAFDGPETALWTWTDGETDGGAIGPLGESFDVRIVHRFEGSVGDSTDGRFGIGRWLWMNGGTRDAVELATFAYDDGIGDVSARLFTTDG